MLIPAALLAVGGFTAGCRRSEIGSDQPASDAGLMDPPPPEYVYVPAPNFEVRVSIDVPALVRVGEAVRLRATRQSIGQWTKIRHANLPPDARWYTLPWPEREAEVAANLTWLTNPPLAMRMDVGLRSLALGMQREAVFKASGKFDVWALTAVPLQAKSNVVTVEVRD